jgi:metal-responsive CopG/Arc/MetJ family transcriptional regulator
MRTTIELKRKHRSRLLAMAAERGEKGFSNIVAEAVEAYLNAEGDRQRRRQKALSVQGSLKAHEARQLREHAAAERSRWR